MKGGTTMRFMIIVKATKKSEAGVMPSEQLLSERGKFNEELVKAGVMLAGEGLRPSSKGARIKFSGGKRTVTDGPFAETKELVAGFWLWQVKSFDEAVEWLKRAPFDGGTEVEIRQVFETADIDDQHRRGEDRRIELLLLGAVRAYGGHERSRFQVLAPKQRSTGRRAGDADVAARGSFREIGGRRDANAQPGGHLLRELRR